MSMLFISVVQSSIDESDIKVSLRDYGFERVNWGGPGPPKPPRHHDGPHRGAGPARLLSG